MERADQNTEYITLEQLATKAIELDGGTPYPDLYKAINGVLIGYDNLPMHPDLYRRCCEAFYDEYGYWICIPPRTQEEIVDA